MKQVYVIGTIKRNCPSCGKPKNLVCFEDFDGDGFSLCKACFDKEGFVEVESLYEDDSR